jgi:hypothetical protein
VTRLHDLPLLATIFSFVGLATACSAPVAEDTAFKAPTSARYSFGWSLDSGGTPPASLTWTFSCS